MGDSVSITIDEIPYFASTESNEVLDTEYDKVGDLMSQVEDGENYPAEYMNWDSKKLLKLHNKKVMIHKKVKDAQGREKKEDTWGLEKMWEEENPADASTISLMIDQSI
jgi:hypothetical protein